MTKVVGEDRPDYAALAAEQEVRAAVHRTDAERTKSQAQALEDSAQAKEPQTGHKQGEADTLRRSAAAHRTEAEALDQQATQKEQDAARWRALAERSRSRVVEPPKIRYNACSMPSTGPWPTDPRPLPMRSQTS